ESVFGTGTVPTPGPTVEPTVAPTAEPTTAPTAQPTVAPTAEPTTQPSADPTRTPAPAPAGAVPPRTGSGLASTGVETGWTAAAALALLAGGALALGVTRRRRDAR
ncbi:hypothetical protein C5D04_17765, partial [Rathayibacter sp. AY1D2]|uniref:LPXTG cell wall anchor domain-containing protein n=1 Tax=Rathayibacter sp. AY1D2 TaxID=2080543 RepID=UPI000D4B9FDF